MSTALEVVGLWKQYRYGSIGYGSLRRDLQSWWASVRGRDDPNTPLLRAARSRIGAGHEDRFWALEDIDFSIDVGDVVGIVGANGAGKSTLLKILSRVTSPTLGEARIRGRVASLLEVGTGFHPDLTGRENIFLNGAILGMTRSEVRRKLDEIIAFADLERFVDTPVKRYSSGMYVRLAFAVAAHLEPEVLLVDEVLAVGDLEFQRKCLGKLEAVAGEGRTVLFVSHNLGAVKSLCPRAILISEGRIARFESTMEVLRLYMNHQAGSGSVSFPAEVAGAQAWLVEAELAPTEGAVDSIPVSSPLTFRLVVRSRKRLEGMELSLRIERQDGLRVFTTSAGDMTGHFTIEVGTWEHNVQIPGMLLAPGAYFATIAIHRPNIEFLGLYEQVLSFTVVETGSEAWRYHGVDRGAVLVRLPWASRLERPSGGSQAACLAPQSTSVEGEK